VGVPTTFDQKYCEGCDGESSVDWVEVEEEPETELATP
jgi:hypothetical protein